MKGSYFQVWTVKRTASMSLAKFPRLHVCFSVWWLYKFTACSFDCPQSTCWKRHYLTKTSGQFSKRSSTTPWDLMANTFCCWDSHRSLPTVVALDQVLISEISNRLVPKVSSVHPSKWRPSWFKPVVLRQVAASADQPRYNTSGSRRFQWDTAPTILPLADLTKPNPVVLPACGTSFY